MSVKTGAIVLLILGGLLFSVGFTINQDYQNWEDKQNAKYSNCINNFHWNQCDYITNAENPHNSGAIFGTPGMGLMIVGLGLLLYDEWDLT